VKIPELFEFQCVQIWLAHRRSVNVVETKARVVGCMAASSAKIMPGFLVRRSRKLKKSENPAAWTVQAPGP